VRRVVGGAANHRLPDPDGLQAGEPADLRGAEALLRGGADPVAESVLRPVGSIRLVLVVGGESLEAELTGPYTGGRTPPRRVR
jgi:hypothetical protein